MIKKLRLRFIIASLLSVLFVLVATIAGINIANYLKTNREIKQSLNGLVEDLDHNNCLFYGWDQQPQENIPTSKPTSAPSGSNPGGNPGGGNPGGNPGGHGGFRQPNLEGQYFYYTYSVTKYSDREEAEEPVSYSDYSHIISAQAENAQTMVDTVFNGTTNEGKIDNYRYIKVIKEYKYKTTRQPWETGTWETYTVDTVTTATYVAFIDTAEKTHATSNYLLNSVLIAVISYSLLAFLIIVSSHFIFKPSEESYRKQKAFVTNASHELKTPLTIISTDLELIKMDHGDNEWIDSINDQVRRLTVMTKQLVTLSKLDESDLKNFPFTNLSLSKIANDSVASFLPLCEKNEFKFHSDIDEGIELKGNNNLINELFYIFMDNANKYTTPKGEIGLTIKKDNKNKIKVTFYNDIEDDEIDVNQMFERFYRSPNSNKKEGSGIGLSIAKEIVDLHKGKVKASIKDTKILFEISF